MPSSYIASQPASLALILSCPVKDKLSLGVFLIPDHFDLAGHLYTNISGPGGFLCPPGSFMPGPLVL